MKFSKVVAFGFTLLTCNLPIFILGQDNETDIIAKNSESQSTYAISQSEEDTDSFTLIILPDTQGYADIRHKETQKHWPGIGDQRACFFEQTEWIKKKQRALNIVMAVHVGDITQTEQDEEWQIADTAFKTLDNHVPYVLCSGNHDMGYSPQHLKTSYSRDSLFSSYFPPSRFKNNPLYTPLFGRTKDWHFKEEGKIENYYLFLEAGGMKFLILTLEFKPRDETLDWANHIVAQHPNFRTLIVTHSYLTSTNGKRSEADNYQVKGNSGQSVWEKFINQHKNIFLVLSGHAMENLLTSTGKHGNTVHQVQADYWYWDNPWIKAGSGFLRIMTFHPDKDMIEVQTYSPVLDEYLDRPTSKFTLNYTMKGKNR
ncbi:MAG: metallophosphoesterase [Verrucomicrobia bacterium]|nr:metallophosphoesterase [Verrucomicrobiota bacterium]